MFNFIKKSRVNCKRKVKPLRMFRNDKGDVLRGCIACGEYAERRAYRKVK